MSLRCQTAAMRALASAGAGFLACVLWFDLMFDIQARGRNGGELAPATRSSIAAYYARVTTGARPMNRLVAVAMVITVIALIGEAIRDELPLWRAVLSLTLTVGAIGLAGARTVRNAVRLGHQLDDAATQSRLARTILRDHIVCISAIAAVLVLQLLPA
jgi:hypothetical protein